jgi:hypothetical protein
MKGGSEIMNQRLNSSFSTHFQQIFAAYCVLMTDSCVSLFFRISYSELTKLLITNTAFISKKSNRIQTNFDSNVAIRTFEFSLASKPSRKKTNLFEQLALLPSNAKRGGVQSLRAAEQA